MGRRLARLERLARPTPSIRASSIPPAAASGRRTRASSTARCSAKLGDGSYEVGSRARIIRDRLLAREHFTARDLLDIQLDTRADFLSRWRDLIAADADGRGGRTAARERALFRDMLASGWSGEASPDSVGYRLTRAFRDIVSERVMAFVLSECYEADPSFDYTTVRRRDAAILKLVTEQPLHLLDPQYASWDELLLDAVDATIEQAMRERQRHPARSHVVRVQRRGVPASAVGGHPAGRPLARHAARRRCRAISTRRACTGARSRASERMVVSPGREAEGIMHMPTGQSGHPLSPFYANSHDAWAKGEPTPFLPGPAVYTLTLTP